VRGRAQTCGASVAWPIAEVLSMVLNPGGDPLAQGVRRVTTGVDARGKAVIVDDARLEGQVLKTTRAND
jgi:hypothetical protein